MGAWIETLERYSRGYKEEVAPYMGAWIETAMPELPGLYDLVAPYMGAWIETFNVPTSSSAVIGRSLHGGVD